MARFRTPANIQLHRAQIVLILATLVPTIFLSATGIVLLAIGNDTPSLVIGVLVIAFCTTSLTGYILGSIFMNRGAQIVRFQNDFLSSVSHELRTPLTSIGLFIETLRDQRHQDEEEKKQCLDLLSQEVTRLSALVEKLLNLSKIEAGAHGFVDEPVSVKELAKGCATAFAAATLPDSPDLKVSVQEGLHVLGDKQALEQALTNLLVNAWKYSHDTKDLHIGLEARSVRNHVEIVVRDNGPGIPLDEQAQIFEEFERGRETANESKARGSGLGLAIVRAIVRAHRGRIDLQSNPGHGSQFRLRLRKP